MARLTLILGVLATVVYLLGGMRLLLNEWRLWRKKGTWMAVLLCCLVPTTSLAATQYVREAAGGAGTSWSDAWSDVTSINWGGLSPGDTVWIAGGTYGTMTFAASGNADTDAGRIFIKRATVAAHGTDTGWSAAYDAQVNVTQFLWDTLNVGGYVTVDGQQTDGIRVSVASGALAALKWDRGAPYITIRRVELAGPCGPTPCVQGGDNRGLDATAFNGVDFDLVDRLLIQYSHIHGFCTLMFLANADNSIIEHNDLADSVATDTVPCHNNLIFAISDDNITVRYNRITNWSAEGIILSVLNGSPASGAWDIYGNLWYRGAGAGPFDRVVETRLGDNGPVRFYNNTVVDTWKTWNDAGGTWATGTESTNNIYWNTPGNEAISPSYDFCSLGTCTGTGTIVNGSNPFVNPGSHDYHLVSTIAATYPRDKGTNLGAPYGTDLDGMARGGDGLWDMGAYEFQYDAAPSPVVMGRVLRWMELLLPVAGLGWHYRRAALAGVLAVCSISLSALHRVPDAGVQMKALTYQVTLNTVTRVNAWMARKDL